MVSNQVSEDDLVQHLHNSKLQLGRLRTQVHPRDAFSHFYSICICMPKGVGGVAYSTQTASRSVFKDFGSVEAYDVGDKTYYFVNEGSCFVIGLPGAIIVVYNRNFEFTNLMVEDREDGSRALRCPVTGRIIAVNDLGLTRVLPHSPWEYVQTRLLQDGPLVCLKSI